MGVGYGHAAMVARAGAGVKPEKIALAAAGGGQILQRTQCRPRAAHTLNPG